jgi:hypothetical protein
MQQIAASWTTVLLFDAEALTTWLENQQQALAEQRVGDRPDRVEPRAIKRRPKPRKEARAELLAG